MHTTEQERVKRMGRGTTGSRGFSLVEVLAVSALLTLLLAVLYPLAQSGWRNWYHTSVETELRNAANLVMGAVEKDLMRASVVRGQEAVDVTGQQLKIVTEWTDASPSAEKVPKHVVVYTIEQDGLTGQTHIYRYAGPPSPELRGMRLAGEDVDFSGSMFQRQSHRRTLVKLHVAKQQQTLYTVASYRYGYGSLPQVGE